MDTCSKQSYRCIIIAFPTWFNIFFFVNQPRKNTIVKVNERKKMMNI